MCSLLSQLSKMTVSVQMSASLCMGTRIGCIYTISVKIE